jgi:23S rRNA pseudouridine1911/1915/1917 synthase
LYEDNHLLAVNKPAMLPTMGVAADRPSLLTLAKEYVRRRYNKPGNVYLGIVSRLDAPVTGIVLLARTSKAAGRLSQQFRERDVEKIYWAIVEGRVDPPNGRLIDFLRKDERHRRMHVSSPETPGAQRAELEYRLLMPDKETGRQRDKETGRQGDKETQLDNELLGFASSSWRFDSVSIVEVRLLTGRKHQIRVQLSHAGFPIVGDRKYGARKTFPLGIALHSRRLVFNHPVRKMEIAIEAPPPTTWRRYLREN